MIKEKGAEPNGSNTLTLIARRSIGPEINGLMSCGSLVTCGSTRPKINGVMSHWPQIGTRQN